MAMMQDSSPMRGVPVWRLDHLNLMAQSVTPNRDFDPGWKPITWHEKNLDKRIIWYGSPLSTEYFLCGTPSPEVAAAPLTAVSQKG